MGGCLHLNHILWVGSKLTAQEQTLPSHSLLTSAKLKIQNSMDKRTKTYKIYSKWVNPYTRAAFVWGLIIGAFVGIIIADARNASPNALNQKIVPKVEIVQATTDKYQERGYAYCYNPIICIRDVGEELGVPNQDIITMIKIARAESGLRADALNKNSNGTFDVGVFQINDVHKISRQDRMDFEKNIRFAYKLYKAQGFNPWNSSRNKWEK